MEDLSRLARTVAITTTLAVATLGVSGPAGAASAPGKAPAHAHGKSGKQQSEEHRQDKGRSRGRSAGAPHAPKGDRQPGGHGQPGQPPGHDGTRGTGQAPGQQDGRGGGRPGDPAGNNGTVKVTPIGEDDGTPQNTPHVPCGFDVEWYGFDEGGHIVSEVTFESWAPTAVPMTVDGPAEVFVGADPATGAGTDSGFDGEATYTLSFDGAPHPQQGYHVKLTIHTPGSLGADTKHKVYWVEPCEDTAGQPEQPAGEITSPESDDQVEVLGEQDTTPNDETGPEVLGEQETAPSDDDEVEVRGVEATRGVPTAVAAGLAAADRWGSALSLLLLLLGGLTVGAGVVRRRRSA